MFVSQSVQQDNSVISQVEIVNGHDRAAGSVSDLNFLTF